MRYQGANRRRRDLRGRLQRLAYGLLLAFSAAQASAAPSDKRSEPSAEEREDDPQLLAALVLVQSWAEDRAQPALFGASFSRAASGELSERQLSSAAGEISRGLVTLSFSDDDLRRIKDGLGLDIELPDLGYFHLNLYSRKDSGLPGGKRFGLIPAGEREGGPRRWSLGGSLDLVRPVDGERELVLVPQLMIDMAALIGSDKRFDVCVQYAHWRARNSREVSAERVPQATLRFSF